MNLYRLNTKGADTVPSATPVFQWTVSDFKDWKTTNCGQEVK